MTELPRRPPPPLATLAVVALASALPGVTTARLVREPVVVPLAVGSTALATILVAALHLRRRPHPAVVAVTAALALPVWVVVATLPLGPDPAGAVGGLVTGWADLLTTALPADATAGRIACLLALVWVAGAGGAALTLGSRSAASPLGPPLAGLVAGTLLGAGRPTSGLVAGGAFLVCGAIVLALRSGRSLTPSGVAPLVALAAAITIGGSTLAGPATLGRDADPYDPRVLVPVEVDRARVVNPLNLLASLQADPNEPMFRSVGPAPDRWQLVVLDRFDGAEWTSGGAFTSSGTAVELQGPAPASPSTTTTVRLEGLPGIWLPAPSAPSRVEGAGVAVDERTGVLVGRRSGSGTSYVVTGRSRPTGDQVSVAVPDTGIRFDHQAEAAAALPDSEVDRPPSLEAAARQAISGTTDPLLTAQRLQRYLLDPRFVSRSDADPGHSYAHLARFVAESRTGTSEQFATAFAVMGRMVGLPTRVVVGFTTGEGTDAERLVLSRHSRAWPEVFLAGRGWVVFDPTPPLTVGGGRATTTTTAPPPPTTVARPDISTDQVLGSPAERAGDGRSPLYLVVGLVVVTAMLLAAAVPVAKSSRRRRGRRSRDPRARTTAAWADVVNRLTDRGTGDLAGRTVAEVAAIGGAALGPGGAAHLDALRPAVNRAAFDPTFDSDGGLGAADTAWTGADGIARHLRAVDPPMRRLRTVLNPRSLRPRA